MKKPLPDGEQRLAVVLLLAGFRRIHQLSVLNVLLKAKRYCSYHCENTDDEALRF